MNDDLERRVARLEAAEEIRRLKARYAKVCDTGYEPDRMVPLFTADAVWDGGERFGRYEGIDAIHGFFAGVSSQIVWALHYMVAPAIEGDGDAETASASWYLWQPCTVVGDEGPQAVWLTGTYADRYRKDADAWKFARVQLECQTISPFEEGWVRRPFWNEEPR
jgi:SnoaL-like domain